MAILGGAFLLYAVPILYMGIPPYFSTPDLYYVKAKALWVMNGFVYNDPVSGMPTFHPPYYHLVLALFMRLGFPIDSLVMAFSLLNVALLGLFVFLTIRRLFDTTTAGLVVLLLPFVNRFMGSDYLFLASSFSFSLPFFFAGIWLYLHKKGRISHTILASVCWGASFLISPGNIFLLGLIFLYELIIRRAYRRFLLMSVVFIVAISPFFYQAYVVSKSGIGTTTTFSLWRGFPGVTWLGSLASRILAPATGRIIDWHVLPTLAILAAGIAGYLRAGSRHPMPVIALIAFVLTFYHFNPQYASRVYYVFSIFLAGYACQWLVRRFPLQAAGYAIILLLAAYPAIEHAARTFRDCSEKLSRFDAYNVVTSRLQAELIKHVRPASFVLASSRTYRNFVMPYFPARSFVAYRSGEYFQLPPEFAEQLLDDYRTLMSSTDKNTILLICGAYGIRHAIWVPGDQHPVFGTIDGWWDPIAVESGYRIYQLPRQAENMMEENR